MEEKQRTEETKTQEEGLGSLVSRMSENCRQELI